MAPPVFPTLAGQGWSVHKRPSFATRVASHVSGREVRSAYYAQTLYEFELTYDALLASSNPALAGLGASSLQTLLGFYLACQGQLGTFLYVDPTDSAVINQPVGSGDGSTAAFTLQRTLGGFSEPVSWVTGVNGVFVNGAAQSGWALATPNILTLAVPPPTGAVVTASFAYAFACRFLDDQQDFENIMSGLWQLKALKFRSVRTS
jgi:uncharacterized protein (TIGR02217 family)